MKKKNKPRVHENLRLQKLFWTAKPDKYSRKLRSEALSDQTYFKTSFKTRYPLDVGHQGVFVSDGGAFAVNDKICRDRQKRREVLFASGKAGRIKVRRALWTEKSQVRCN